MRRAQLLLAVGVLLLLASSPAAAFPSIYVARYAKECTGVGVVMGCAAAAPLHSTNQQPRTRLPPLGAAGHTLADAPLLPLSASRTTCAHHQSLTTTITTTRPPDV
jgi:hypothetical protein